MPIYTYRCGTCEGVFDIARPMSDVHLVAACPQCHGSSTSRVYLPVSWLHARAARAEPVREGKTGMATHRPGCPCCEPVRRWPATKEVLS